MSTTGRRRRALNVGVFGGSFDPVHIGHLVVAEQAAVRLGLDGVRFVPAALQPLKSRGPEASAAHRVAMLRLAIQDNPHFMLDCRELGRAGPSYTVDTLRELRTELPGDALFLLVGADAARDVPQWHEAETLVGLATIVVLTRPGAEVPANRWVSRVLDVPGVAISATQIRDAIRRGESVRYLVPREVENYIQAHGLYRHTDAC